jgi:glycosyltransferase involved in cell wall biosynthesis
MPGWIVWLALKGIHKSERPNLISTVHGLHSVNFYSAVMTKPENIIAVSEASRNYIIKNYTKSQSKNINLIYRGVDDAEYFIGYQPTEDWISEWYKEYPATRSAKLLTIAGRISPLKDFEKIINLAASIKENSSHNIKVLIAGEVKDKHQKYLIKLKKIINYLKLENDIYFLNFRNDIKNIYAISSIVYNTSNKPESFGRSILEPLSIGIPSIGYNRGGVKEILDELYPFGAVDPKDIDSLLLKSLSILDGNDTPIKKNTKFITSEMCQQTLNLYRNISS